VSSPGGILDNGLGDHETIAPRSTAVTGSFALLQNATLLARIAGALGKLDAKKRYEAEAKRIREAIRKKFYSESGTFGIESQACYAGALFHGVLTAKEAIPGLVRAVQAADGHVNAGIFGTMWLLEALSRHGRSDLAVQIATQRTFPGWGHMLANGATSLWETWKESDDTFSNNHPMFGSVAGWMMRWLVGIQVPDDSFAGDHVVIRPQTMTTITEAAGQWQSRRGLVGTRWERKGRYLMMNVTIPASVTADVHVPAGAGALISESGRSLTGHPDIQVIKRLKSAVVVNIGSGTYRVVVDSGQTGA
jgi:alpha-L-rhamnosidase